MQSFLIGRKDFYKLYAVVESFSRTQIGSPLGIMRMQCRKKIGCESVGKFYKIGARTIIPHKLPHFGATISQDCLYGFISGQIGIPKSVNGLFWITNDKQFARLELKFSCSIEDIAKRYVLMLVLFFAQVKYDLVLNRIRILHFVNQNQIVPVFHFSPDRAIGQQLMRESKQVIVEHVSGLQRPAVITDVP